MDTKSERDQYQSSKTIDELPDDVLRLIFTQLNFRSTLLCGRVCQRWLKVTSENITFMRKVQLNLKLDPKTDSIPTLVRTYKVIKIENWLIRGLEIFRYCEQLVLVKCEFINAGHLSHMLADCKRLKTLELHMPRLAAYGSDGLEVVENCTKNFPIDLKLTFGNVSSWVILQWFKTINLDISLLQIEIFYEVCNSEIASMMDYIHQNHRSTFKTFHVMLDDSTLSPLFISQIKHLTSFKIIQKNNRELPNQICNNLPELRKLRISIFTDIGNLNILKSLLNLESLQIDVFPYYEELMLYINELQQLKELKIRRLNHRPPNEIDGVLQFADLTPKQPLCSITHLRLLNFVITRNVFQLIFKIMPNLVLLEINKNIWTTQKKRLSQNKNDISRLKKLQTLEIANFWVDDNFLYNMKLPQLKKFTLLGLAWPSGRPHINFSQIGLFFLARQCPKLMEITDKRTVIASRKNTACPFNYHFDQNGDGESSGYSEEDGDEDSDEPMEPDF
jgi:hypothetical protein